MLDEADVLRRDDRPALDLLPRLIIDEPDLNRIAPDLKRVHADNRPRQSLTHVRVHALDDGDHRHQECDRHDDAQQREERAELVAPDGLEGEADGFEERHGVNYNAKCGIRNAE